MKSSKEQSNTSNQENIDIDRSKYDLANEDRSIYKSNPGELNETLVRKISRTKNEPDWMLKKRLEGLTLWNKTKMPGWGPSLEKLDLDNLRYFVRPGLEETTSWEDLPEDIKETYEKIGIPEAEKKSLSGVGAQYDSEVVYHKLKKEWEEKGVIFENMDEAVQKYPELVKEHFMTRCVPVNDHKFTMLHAAVWSGGTFIYIPKNVKMTIPLQAYFRMNAKSAGQFEHTLIIVDEGAEVHYVEGCSAPQYQSSSLHAGCVEIFVKKNAKIRYSSVENWSKNTFNLNTKRALVEKNAIIEWVNGNLGSGVTMLYPTSVLIGENAKSDSLGIAFAGKNQNQDAGSKVIHLASNTKSRIISKSISKDGGITTYRGLVYVDKKAINSTTSTTCDALLVGDGSVSNTYPHLKINNKEVLVSHEASVGKIGDEEIFYLMSRGLSEDEAIKLLVTGFIESIVKQLPLEYAVELNKLIALEMTNSVG